MSERIEQVILASLLCDQEYAAFVMPHMRPELFQSPGERAVFSGIQGFLDKYGSVPTKSELVIHIDGTEDRWLYDEAKEVVEALPTRQQTNESWLRDQTERFIERQGQHNFMLDAIHKLDEGEPLPPPEEYGKAITFKFCAASAAPGFSIFDNYSLLHDFMTSENEYMPFDIAELNRITNGGVSRKTLNVILAPTNVGKSLMLCHLAASYLRQGRNVLYVTLEMSEMITAQRIMSNLLDQPSQILTRMPLEEFETEVQQIRGRCRGDLVIREFPAQSASVTTLRTCLQDLKRSKNFIPDVIMVDYLSLCRAASLPKSAKADLYQTVGTIAAEMRGLATEQNAVVWTAMQTNRSGFKAAELELEHTSESYAVNSAADLILGLSQDDGLADARLIKLLKNRNGGISGPRKIVVGVDASRMKMFDYDPANRVSEIQVKGRKRAIAERVNARRPSFAIDQEELSEAV